MPRNVVLIVLDSVRKDYFDEYAPRLRALADVDFDQARAASSWTVPSHASMFTGELPHRHGVHTHNRHYGGMDRDDTFLSALSDHASVGASSNVYLGSAFGFPDLFDDYREINHYRYFADGDDVFRFIRDQSSQGLELYRDFLTATLRSDHPLKTLGNGAYLKARSAITNSPLPTPFDEGVGAVCEHLHDAVLDADGPVFAFANFMEAHPPFQYALGYDRDIADVPYGWSSSTFDLWEVNNHGRIEENRRDVERFRALYAASIDYLDRKLSAFLENLVAESVTETTVVITADHGENLALDGDDDLIGHVGALTEGLLHVPLLVVNPPDGFEAPGGEGYFSHLRLGDSIRAMAAGDSMEIPEREPSVAAELVGGISPNANVPLSEEERRYWNRMIRCYYRDDEKVCWDSLGGLQWYRLDPETPSWQRGLDVDEPVPDDAGRFFDEPIERYKAQAERRETDRSVDASTRQNLERLGYL